MKRYLFFISLFITGIIHAQVGIGTTTPNAALDVPAGTNNYGFLMPRVALTATNVAAPVKNPATGTFLTNTVAEIGTLIFNTATAGVTPNAVIPGIYYWNGTQWVGQFFKGYDKYNKQTADMFLAKNATTFTNIVGLTALTFTAPYEGIYQFTFTGYLGSEKPTAFGQNIGWVEGQFKFTVNGTDYYKYQYSNSYIQGVQQYFQLFNECNVTQRIVLTAGQVVTMNASYRGDGQDGYTNNTTDLAHVVGKVGAALGNECEVNVIYLGR